MSTAGANGAAYDADVATQNQTPEQADKLQADRERYADEAEAAVETIAAKLAGMKESLATTKAEAKRLRAEAQNGGQG